MAVPRRIIPVLLLCVAFHIASCFVPLSSSRTRVNPGIERWSPIFATASNSTLSNALPARTAGLKGRKKSIKRAYSVKKTKDHSRSFTRNKTNKRNEMKPRSKIKEQTSSQSFDSRSSSRDAKSRSIHPNQQEKRKPNGKKGISESRRARIDQFNWLHWVYNQWKDTSPGDLTDVIVIKKMIAAIPKWAKRQSVDSSERAEELLERLIQEALAGNPHMRRMNTTTTTSEEDNLHEPPAMLPIQAFNAAMDAYGKIGDPKGVQRIIRRMEVLRKSGEDDFSHLEADEVSMSCLASAWAKSRSEEAAQRAEAILQYMDIKGLVPSRITYNSVLHAIAVGNQCDRALRAEDLVQRMIQRSEERGEDCHPDVYSYQSLIQAWSRTSLPGAPQKAEQILRFLDDEASSGKKNCHLMAPNAYCFTTVIHSWARSSERNRARHAYQLLNVMTRRYNDAKGKDSNKSKKKKKKPYESLKPNVKTFTSVLNACARPAHESEMEDAFAIAQLTWAELSLGTYGKPNFLSYAAFLAVCATTLTAGSRRDAITKKTFNECIQMGQVGKIVLEKLYIAASPALLHELIGDHLDERGLLKIPSDWNRRIKGERTGGNSLVQKEVTEEVVRKIPKSSQQRLEDVQKFGGDSSIYSESSRSALTGKGEDEISWSRDEFRMDVWRHRKF